MTILIILHILGVVIGAGGAFAGDAMFFSSIRDKKISHTEMRFLKLSSTMVWTGIGIIVLSGIAIFLSDIDHYFHSAKFLAKMTIVAIIIINGVIFHSIHLPRLHRHAESHFPSSDEFIRKTPYLIMSGAISLVSWLSAFVLGFLEHPPFTYIEILGIYGIVLIIAISIGLMTKQHIFGTEEK